MFDKFRDECGVFGIFGHPEAANLAYLGLYALQHRGQESAGICTSDGTTVYTHKAMGHVADIFPPVEARKFDEVKIPEVFVALADSESLPYEMIQAAAAELRRCRQETSRGGETNPNSSGLAS
jgi:glutamine phosphoribosylpyrophosphate amidotransferase